jgi:hypothetical protein
MKTCKHCGVSFEPKFPIGQPPKYCSKECGEAVWVLNKKNKAQADLEAYKKLRHDSYEKNKRSYRARHLMKNYGMTIEQYERLLAKQDGHCALCLAWRPSAHRSSLYVDHDHETGAVRGLLCSYCNQQKVAANTYETALEVVRYLAPTKLVGLTL